MANVIKLKRGSGSDPQASDLEVGELAIRTDSGKIFTKKDNGSVAEISGGGGIDDGDKGDITVANGGDTFTIDSGVIDNANIASNAAIAGSKINPSFTSDITISNTYPRIYLTDTNNNSDYVIINNDGNFLIYDGTNTADRFSILANGTVRSHGNFDALGGLDVTGNISCTGTVDGRDLATDGSKLDGIESGATADQTASEILTLIKTVDGAGSGLNADLLDGISSASFLRTDAADTCTQPITFSGGIILPSTGEVIKFGAGDAANDDAHIEWLGGSNAGYLRISTSDDSDSSGSNEYIEFGDYPTQNRVGTFTQHVRISRDRFLVRTGSNSISQADRLNIDDAGTVDIYGNLDVGAGLDVTGNISVTGTVDGVDIATRDTLFGGLTSSSGVLTNGVTATTQSAGNNTTRVATTAFVSTAISNLIDSSPSTLNTLNELASALGDDPNFATTVTNSIATKMPLAGGTFSGDVTFNGGASAATIGTDSDIRFTNGTWTGDAVKIQQHANRLYVVGGSAGIRFREMGVDRWDIDPSGHFVPRTDSTYNIGSTSIKVANGYFDNLHGAGANITALNASNLSSGTVPAARLGTSSASESGISVVGNFGQWQGHSTYTDFNTEPAYWGWNFIQGSTNAPNSTSSQWYRCRLSLGSGYGKGSDSNDYSLEMALPRYSHASSGGLHIRTIENGSEGSWTLVGSNASLISTGTLPAARLPNHSAALLTSGTLPAARLPNHSAALLTSGTIPAARLSASDLLTKIKTVDGSGSGLDADTLDGLGSGSFVRSNANDSITGLLTITNDSGLNIYTSTNAAGAKIKFSDNTNQAQNGTLTYKHSDGAITQTGGNSNDGWVFEGTETRTVVKVVGDIEATSNIYGAGANITALNASNITSGTLAAARLPNHSASLLTSGTIPAARVPTLNQNTTGNAATASDAALLDGLDSSQFLRSDNSDVMTGNFTLDGNFNMSAGHIINHSGTASRDKIRVWDASAYAIGMDNAMSFGGLNDYAMTFQMNSDADRGWVFLDDSHSDAQGAMSLTTQGKMGLAHSLRVGYGESDTTTPGATYRLDVNGATRILGDLAVGDGSATTNRILIKKSDNNVSDHIIFYNGTTRIGEIGCEDTTWLRINQETAKNIYTPRYIRADAGFFVDGTSKGINGSGNFIGGTIAGASDYGTLVRSNASDTLTGGTYTFNSSTDQKIILQGATSPYIRFQEGTTNKAFVQWHSDGYLRLKNQEDSATLHIKDDFVFSPDDSTFYTIWHSGNDGSGSGLDADTLDGIGSGSFTRSDANDNVTGHTEWQDNYHVRLGNGADMRLYHNGSNSYIDNITGHIYIRNTSSNDDSNIYLMARNEENSIICEDDGDVRLFSNGTEVFRTDTTSSNKTKHLYPWSDSAYDLGTSSNRFRNIYADTLYGDGSNLTGISAGAQGGGSDEVFWCNGQTVTSSYTIPNGKNAMSAGPITINNGVTVTVGSGETWTVV